jgi:hypothetical protein
MGGTVGVAVGSGVGVAVGVNVIFGSIAAKAGLESRLSCSGILTFSGRLPWVVKTLNNKIKLVLTIAVV